MSAVSRISATELENLASRNSNNKHVSFAESGDLASQLNRLIETTARTEVARHREYVWSPLSLIWKLLLLMGLLFFAALFVESYSSALCKIVLEKAGNQEALRRLNNDSGSNVSTATMMAHTENLPIIVQKAEFIVARDMYGAALSKMSAEIGLVVYAKGINYSFGRYIEAALSQIIVMTILMCLVIVMAFYSVISVVLQLIRAFTVRRVVEKITVADSSSSSK
jgi:hypothetical protein